MTIHKHENQDALDYVPDPSTGSTGQAITVKAGGGYELTAVGGGSGEAVKKTITQASHGFSAGDILKYDGSAYALAQADTTDNAEAVGIIESVTDTNNFVLLTEGFISITGMSWTAGTTYRLSSDTAGALTADDPEDQEILRPLLNALSTTTGWFSVKLAVIFSEPAQIMNPSGLIAQTNGSALDILDFVTETSRRDSSGSWSNNHYAGGRIHSKYRGYAVGYHSGATGTKDVDAVRFCDLARISIGTTQRSNQGMQASAQDMERGYLIGGSDRSFSQGYRDIARMLLDREIIGTYIAVITGRDEGIGVSSDTYGYSMGGQYLGGANPGITSSIQRVKLSDATVAGVSATLSVAKHGGMAFNSSAKGYYSGGLNSSSNYQTAIDALTFSGETVSTLSSSISQGRAYGAAVNSTTHGYYCGGSTGSASARIDRVQFSDDSVTNLGDSIIPPSSYQVCGSGWQTHGII